jgi:hypothetical protein
LLRNTGDLVKKIFEYRESGKGEDQDAQKE